jgi:hypothetical protein
MSVSTIFAARRSVVLRGGSGFRCALTARRTLS